MINIPKINRPNKEVVEKIKNLGSATVSGTLYGMGISCLLYTSDAADE